MSINATISDPNQKLRWAIYWLLILSAVGNMVGRIWVVESNDEASIMLSANDRSRWATIRALVEDQSYEIDRIIEERDPIMRNRRPWFTIDLVRHRSPIDGEEHYYSSKPPLYPTMVAGIYSVINGTLKIEMADQAHYIMRLILVLVNVVPLVLYFYLLAIMLEKYCRTDWARIAIMGCATWATFITTFAVTLNNHLPAAVSVMITLYAATCVWRDRSLNWGYFFTAGLFSAFTFANELPALSFLLAVATALTIRSPKNVLLGFVPGAAIVLAAFFLTNYRAHGDWLPPYFHRGTLGEQLLTIDDPDMVEEIKTGTFPSELLDTLEKRMIAFNQKSQSTMSATVSNTLDVKKHRKPDQWTIEDPSSGVRWMAVRDGSKLNLHVWGDWYDYPGSYWVSDDRSPIDMGEPSRRIYAFNITIGHHGLFSLTPIWALSMLGMLGFLVSGTRQMRGFGFMTLAITVACLAFFVLFRSEIDRNYGGQACGFRWMFWLTPLYLLCLIPVADSMANRPLWRWVGLLCFLFSVISATYPSLNPWSHPWIYDYWQYIEYPRPWLLERMTGISGS